MTLAAPLILLLAAAPPESPAQRIAGEVVDPAGVPVSNAIVFVEGADERPVRTGRLGRFELAEVPAGRVRVRAAREAGDLARGWAAWTASAEVSATAAATPLRLVLGPAGAPVSGTVLDPAGRPVPGVEVWSVPPTYPAQAIALLRGNEGGLPPDDGLVSEARTDRAGAFRVPRTVPGNVLLVGRPHAPLWLAGRVEASAAPVRLLLPEPLRVRGIASSRTGRPLEAVFVEGGGYGLPAQFDVTVDAEIAAAGWVGIGAAGHRTRWIRASPAKDGLVDAGRVVLEAGDDAVQRRVRVRAVDERTGAPVREVSFERAEGGYDAWRWRGEGFDGEADARGFHTVPAGDGPEEVDVIADGYALARVRLEPAAVEQEVRLEPEGTLKVTFARGESPSISRKVLIDGPVPIGAALLRPRAGLIDLVSLPAGRYVIRVLPAPDLGSLRFAPEGGPSWRGSMVELTAGGHAEVSLDLPAPGDGAAVRLAHVPGVCLHLVDGPAPVDARGVRAMLGYAPARMGPDDVFEDVPAGRYTLVAFAWRAGGLQLASAPLALRPGKARAAIEIPVGASLLAPEGPAVPEGKHADDLGCGLDGPIGRPSPR